MKEPKFKICDCRCEKRAVESFCKCYERTCCFDQLGICFPLANVNKRSKMVADQNCAPNLLQSCSVSTPYTHSLLYTDFTLFLSLK